MTTREQLRGQVALITGAAVGLGRGFAEALGALGMNLAICDVRQEIVAVGAELAERHGVRCVARVADVSVPADVFAFVDQAAAELGGLDVVVNNAGINLPARATDTLDKSVDLFDRIVGVNTFGVFLVGRAAMPYLAARGSGHLVNISTDHVYTEPGRPTGGRERMDIYDASKWALNGFTLAWAKALADRNIRVNALCMGATDSEMLRSWSGGNPTPEKVASWKTPAELAGVLIELLTEPAPGRTGTNIPFWVDPPSALPPESQDWSERVGRMKSSIHGRRGLEVGEKGADLKGRVAIVTGTGRGLGAVSAARLKEEGVTVVGCDLHPGRHVDLIADVSTREGVDAVVALARRRHGGADILVNNAARWARTPVSADREKAAEDFWAIMGTNFKGPLMLERAVLPDMLTRPAADIVNISTYYVLPPRSRTNPPDTDVYNASKWALCGLTQSWALLLAETPVRVNALAMGATDTPLLRDHYLPALPPVDAMATWMTPAQQADLLIALLREGPEGRTGETIGSWVGEPVVLPTPRGYGLPIG